MKLLQMRINDRRILKLIRKWLQAGIILYTTKDLGIPEEKFKIDITAGTSSRMN